MRITCLVEDTSHNDLLTPEHGLSLYIESRGHRVLFDMGQTNLFARNADALGIDLAEVDAAIISHGHISHGGGLAEFLRINDRAPVYVHEDAFEPHYDENKNFIGLPSELKDHPRLVKTSFKQSVLPYMTLFSWGNLGNRHHMSLPVFYKESGGRMTDDDFAHEQYLYVYEEKAGTVLFTGCAHGGILNFNDKLEPSVIIGGIHCNEHSSGAMTQLAAQMLCPSLKYNSIHQIKQVLTMPQAKKFYVSHCMGELPYEHLKKHLHHMEYLSCGDVLEI